MTSRNQNSERKKLFEKCLEECKNLGDDSYDVVKKLEEFKKIRPCNPRIKHNDLSFITHAAAIKFLYSTDIQNVYKEKRRNVEIFKHRFDYDILEKSISGSAKHIVEFDENFQFSEVRKVISDTIYNDLEGFIKAAIDRQKKVFFVDLINPKGNYGFNSGDLLGWRKPYELGNLNIVLKETSLVFSIVTPKNNNVAIEFYSNLCLLNNLEKIRMKFGDLGEQKKRSKWKYSENASVEIKCRIKEYRDKLYKGVEVLVNNESLSYAQFYANFDLNSSGKTYLLHPFTGGSSRLSPFEASLHFLLFGAEVMRNPSALIHNMMLLDLIKNGELSWEEVFKGGTIPMDTKHSERASRIINDGYNDFMPHEYSFDISFENFSQNFPPQEIEDFYEAASIILEKELKIVRKWLKMKFGNAIGDLHWFYNELEIACGEWFQVNID